MDVRWAIFYLTNLLWGFGGLWPPPNPCGAYSAEKKMKGRYWFQNVSRRLNAKKSRDWVLYAYIITRSGGEISLHELINQLNAWPKRDNRSSRVGQVLGRNKRRGFLQVERFRSNGRYVSIWSFDGEIPQIPPRTLRDWDKKFNHQLDLLGNPSFSLREKEPR